MNFAKKNFSTDCVDIGMIKAYTQCSLEAQFTSDQQIVVSFCRCALSPPSSPSISHLLDLSHVGATSRSRQQFDLGGGMLLRVIWIYIHCTRWTLCLMTPLSDSSPPIPSFSGRRKQPAWEICVMCYFFQLCESSNQTCIFCCTC